MTHCPDELLPLLDDLEAGSLVLTPNHLTTTQLLDWYGQWRKSQAMTPVCASPHVYPVDIWIRRQCSALLAAGSSLLPECSLLEPAEESLVWHHVISRSAPGAELLNPGSTARAVQETWALAHFWEIGHKELAAQLEMAAQHEDLAAYLEWTRHFRRFCQDRQLVTQVEMLEQLIPLITGKHIALPANVFLMGFSDPPPLYQRLLEAIGSVSQATHVGLPARQPRIFLQPCKDATGELEAAATWAREVIAGDPDARIGIIVTDLHNRHAHIQRVFSRCFAPAESTSLIPDSSYPFSLSGGHSLTRVPLIRAALLFLNRNRVTTDTLEACQFLRSPFLAGADEEAKVRASLELLLRDRNTPRVSNTDLKNLATMAERPFHSPRLAAALDAFDAIPRPTSGRHRTTRQWGEIFDAQLAALGWPGHRQLSMEEERVMAEWFALLETYYRLTPVFSTMGLDAALTLLLRLADNHTLRTARDDSAIRILTPVEADGLCFSHCRMLGLSEQQWPPPPRVSPFIPFALQKLKKLPETNLPVYTGNMQRVLAGFAARTEQEIVFSYPQQRDDIPLKPALMLRQIVADNEALPCFSGSAMHPLAATLIGNMPAPELMADSSTVPLINLDGIKGGSSLLADQAECPFRSFVRHRLRAKPLEKLVYGLSPRAAGNLVHLALELLWEQLGSQATLAGMNAADLDELARSVVKAAVTGIRKFHFHTMTDSFCALEESRLHELLLQWLEEERKRGSFTVLASEMHVNWEHAGMTLDLRIDRIDQDDSGNLVLVDYKTARSTRIDWEDERPANSQLMLYALATEQERERGNKPELVQAGPVAGVYFAQVNIENTNYTGLSAQPGVYPGTSVEELRGKRHGLAEAASWDDLRQSWETSLAALAGEFLNGCVAITPKSSRSCEYCFVRPVCRIDEVIE